MKLSSLAAHELGDGLQFFTGLLPAELRWDEAKFEQMWALHPQDKHVIHMPGGPVETPRWQQAYGADYHYTGRVNKAMPVPEALAPLRDWARESIHAQLNGLLLNWYEGAKHYIGPHHDSTKGMVIDAPIVTVSFGESRTFRLTRAGVGTKETRDFQANDGVVFVIPYATNLAWKHAVPKSAKYSGRRISVTIRAFSDDTD